MSEDNGRADFGEPEPDEAPVELFPMGTVEGDEKTLKTIIRGGLPVEVTTSVRSAEVPTPQGGLIDPEREGKLLLSYELVKYEPTPQRDGEPGAKKVVGWKIRQVLRPTFVERLAGEADDILERFGVLLSDDPESAGALVDRMREIVANELGAVGA